MAEKRRKHHCAAVFIELANAGGGAGGGDWYGYRYGLQAYGPAQAIVHPYCLIPLD